MEVVSQQTKSVDANVSLPASRGRARSLADFSASSPFSLSLSRTVDEDHDDDDDDDGQAWTKRAKNATRGPARKSLGGERKRVRAFSPSSSPDGEANLEFRRRPRPSREEGRKTLRRKNPA